MKRKRGRKTVRFLVKRVKKKPRSKKGLLGLALLISPLP